MTKTCQRSLVCERPPMLERDRSCEVFRTRVNWVYVLSVLLKISLRKPFLFSLNFADIQTSRQKVAII